MHRGYIKDWRKSLDNPLYKKPLIWHLWGYCLKKASHKKTDCFLGGQVITVERGSFVFGRKKASEETGLTERQIRTALKHLQKLQNLTIKTTNKYSVISITNWDTYQQDENKSDQLNDQLPTSKRPATDHIQECKALKNIPPISPEGLNGKPKRKKIEPPTETQVIEYFVENGFVESAARKAHAYYEAGDWKDSQGKPVKSWKQKMRGVWFKDENIDPSKKQPLSKSEMEKKFGIRL